MCESSRHKTDWFQGQGHVSPTCGHTGSSGHWQTCCPGCGEATVRVARCVTYLTICRSSCAPLPVMSSTASRAGNLGRSVFTLPLSMQSFKSQATAKAVFLCTPPYHSSCCQWGFSLMQIIQRLPLLRFSFLPSLSPQDYLRGHLVISFSKP